jgi:hypothetical protein
VSKPIQDSIDIFTESKKNIDRLFNEIEKMSPKYHQSLVTLQQDYVELWRSATNSIISLEQEYATQAGFLRSMPNFSLQIIRDMVEISIQAYLQQNKFTLDITDTTKQTLTVFNQNTKSFFLLNKEIMAYLVSIYEHRLKI